MDSDSETAAAAAAAGGSSSLGVEKELHDVARAIDKVEREISAISAKIEAGEQAFEAGQSFKGYGGDALLGYLSQLRKEKEQLRKEKEQLRNEKEQLRKEKEQLREEKAKLMEWQQHVGADDKLQKIYDIVAEQRQAQTVSISKATQGIWDQVSARANLIMKPFVGDLGVTPRDGDIPAYQWDRNTESGQAKEYLTYVQNLLREDQARSFALLDGNKECPLNTDALSDRVGFKFRGRPDAVLVVRPATKIPQAKLRVVFEFKKQVKSHSYYQALVTLLLANCHASYFKPFVILTDLNENYVYFWLDDHNIFYHEISAAVLAWGFFDAILDSERWSAEEGVVVPRDDIETIAAPAKRRRLVLDAAAPGAQESDIANLTDLEGFLSADEVRALRLGELLRQLHTIPALEASRKDWEAMFG